MKTNIIITLQVEGLHRWDGVIQKPELREVHFLAYPHRHIFHITAKKEVSHDDRDIEIIMMKRNVLAYLEKHFYNIDMDIFDFGGMSCEMIANTLATVFGFNYVSVMEDGENGAECIYDSVDDTEEIPSKQEGLGSGIVQADYSNVSFSASSTAAAVSSGSNAYATTVDSNIPFTYTSPEATAKTILKD